MSACCRRITAGTAASTAAMSQIQLRRAEVLQLPREFVVTDRRREIVLRSSSRRRWVMEAVGLRSDGGGGVEEEKKIRPCSYAVGDQRAVGNLVGGGDGEVVAEAGGGVEGDRTVEVLVAAGVTVVLGVGNRVLYKLALVPLKHYPFFLAQLATFFRIPTFVVDPLPDGLDRGYIVQWLEKATIEEEYILMAEPGHVFVNPLPNLPYGDQPVAFPFFYIRPAENEKIVRKYYPKENGLVTEIDPIGNSLVIIKKSILENIAPTWMNISLRMKDDPETDKAFGWVLEMYAYAVASALHGVRHTLRKDFMIQVCMIVGKNFIIHYTYGCDYNMKGQLTYGKIGEWRFDKRSYLRGPPPRNLPLPPPGVLESVARLVKMVNEATANIPGWDKL